MIPDRPPIRRFVLEAVAIFLGVTAGLIGDDYREARNDRRLEREALGQMLQDLQIDSDDVRPILEQAAVYAEAMLWLNNSVAAATLSADELSEVLDTLARVDFYSYEASNFTYTGLKASGRLDLIRPLDLRRDLVFYFEDRQTAVEEVNANTFQTVRDFWTRLGPHVDFRAAQTLLPFPSVRVNLETLLEDRDFRYAAVRLGSMAEFHHDQTQQMLDLNRSLAADVDTHLVGLGGAS